jgi:amidase
MPVRRPTPKQLGSLAESYGLHMTDAELQVYSRLIDDALAAYDVVLDLPDNLPAVKYPRAAWYHPVGEENRYNAWYVKTSIRGAAEGKLAGRKIAIKDCMCVAGIPMSVGTQYLEGYIPDVDATVVVRILDAGGEITGKATCPSMCLSGGSHTTWPRSVCNPWNTEKSAGGSSSGSAVLVAVGDADMSLGGDQGGSIRIPAAWCGIVGLKPTYGLVPYTGVGGIEVTVDHVGPMTRTVEDNALLLEVISGADGIDPRQNAPRVTPYRATLKDGLRGLRIGVVKEGFGHPESETDVEESVRQAGEQLTRLGASVEPVSVPVHAIGRAIWTPTILEGLLDLMMLGNGGGTNHGGLFVTSFMDAQSRWRARADELSVSMKTVMLIAGFMKEQYAGRFYGKSQNLIRRMREAYDEALNRFDLLIMPTTPQKATKLPEDGASIEELWESALNMNRNTSPFCGTGHPALSVPCGISEGLPIGLMLIGRHWDEATIYRAAYAFEQSRTDLAEALHKLAR